MEMPKPQNEHLWLKRFVGEWTIEGEAMMGGADQPPVTWKGTERVRTIGDFWAQGVGEGEMPEGGEMTTIMTLGFDPQRKRFIGTYIVSESPHLWIYDGELDADKRVITLNTQGPSMTVEGKMTSFQDIVEFVSDDHRILTSRMLGDDGQWHQIMTAQYRRIKQAGASAESSQRAA